MELRDPVIELRDEGLLCPECGWPKMRASFSFCPRCTARLPEDWHAR